MGPKSTHFSFLVTPRSYSLLVTPRFWVIKKPVRRRHGARHGTLAGALSGALADAAPYDPPSCYARLSKASTTLSPMAEVPSTRSAGVDASAMSAVRQPASRTSSTAAATASAASSIWKL